MTICRRVIESDYMENTFVFVGDYYVETGYGPVKFGSRGDLPGGIVKNVEYWLHFDGNMGRKEFRVCESPGDAEDGSFLHINFPENPTVPLWMELP